MARAFNGTSDVAVTNTPNGIILTQITISMWLYIVAYKTPSFGVALTYDQPGAPQHGCFLVVPSTNTANQVWVGFSNSNATAYWLDGFAQPSAGAWHHWLVVMNRASPNNKVWIDGVAQTLAVVEHDAAGYGTFLAGGQFYLGAESTAVNFQAMRVAELGMWNALWGQAEATALANGASCQEMPQDGIAVYAPLGGVDSPEPRWNGPNPVAAPNHTPIAFVLTGTSFVKNPPVRVALTSRVK